MGRAIRNAAACLPLDDRGGNRRTQGVAVNVPQKVQEQVLEGQARRPFGDAHAMTGGFEARNESLDDPGLPGGRSTLPHRSLFVQDEWTVAKPLTLTFGARYDKHARYGNEWSPRAYAVWRVAQDWTVKGGYSHGFKVPNLKQVVPGARPEGPNTFIGNPDLKPELSDALEIGIGYAAGATQAQLMLFEQRVDDLIEVRLVAPGPTPGIGTYTYENFAKAKLRGVEASWLYPLGQGFTAGFAYTYLDAKSGNGQRLEPGRGTAPRRGSIGSRARGASARRSNMPAIRSCRARRRTPRRRRCPTWRCSAAMSR